MDGSLVETRCWHCETRLLGPGDMDVCELCGHQQCLECAQYGDSCSSLQMAGPLAALDVIMEG